MRASFAASARRGVRTNEISCDAQRRKKAPRTRLDDANERTKDGTPRPKSDRSDDDDGGDRAGAENGDGRSDANDIASRGVDDEDDEDEKTFDRS